MCDVINCNPDVTKSKIPLRDAVYYYYRRSERKVHFKRLMECVRWVYMTTEEVLKCVDMEQELVRSNDVRPVLIDATWYTTLKSYDVTWRDYPIPLPRVRFLRHEDPQSVVNRIRVSLASNRHPSFDTLWPTREAKHRPGSGRSKMRSLPSPGPHGNRFSNGTRTSNTTKSHRVCRSESGDFLMESVYAEAPRRSSMSGVEYFSGERGPSKRHYHHRVRDRLLLLEIYHEEMLVALTVQLTMGSLVANRLVYCR
ncbi:uncharacterized protein LOC129590273 [Paramacrobiotus metropolitanus]|uniref:uncharacterized protein LOC129590273 n=1 Tax=Paramacrobiotus metropolitanus TaxID=2943436 RepID=UPI0024458310|nr:uncharacterized protein LOC129590273 [Paramacrobiotus metropolitanus]